MRPELDALQQIVQSTSNIEAMYQPGKAQAYGRAVAKTYQLVHQVAQRNNCRPKLVLVQQGEPKDQFTDKVLASQLYLNVVAGIIDSAAFRQHLLSELQGLGNFIRVVDHIAQQRGQLPRPPMGYQQLPDGKLGFPEGHPLHPSSQQAPPALFDFGPTEAGLGADPAPQRVDPFEAGEIAYREGVPKTANPYPKHVGAFTQWAEGWQAADEEPIEREADRINLPKVDPPITFYRKLKADDQKRLVALVEEELGETFPNEDKKTVSARSRLLAKHLETKRAEELLGGEGAA